jgi:hypothetical protein
MFNAELQVVEANVANINNRVELHFTMGIAVPQDEGLAFIPGGLVRVPLGKQTAISIGKDLQDEGEKLPDPPKQSDLIIPKNAQKVAAEAKAGPDERP